jgi:murein DD-endopeptidase MepM/ murein hydrolase activator NlpD
MKWPVEGNFRVTSKFGYRIDPVTKANTQFHSGIDIGGLPKRHPIIAPSAGVVSKVWFDTKFGGGNSVVFIHEDGKYKTGYAHLDEAAVKPGDKLEEGDLIGYLGNTGAHTTGVHLHFSMYTKKNGKWVKTDPLTVLDVEKEDPSAEIPLKEI